MTGTPVCVAVEGPCCAGKTTLTRRLRHALPGVAVGVAACYADHVGGGRYLPRPVPESLAEDQQALQRLLAVEAGRVARACAPLPDLLLLDRSVHTLLAHRHALQQLTGLPCLLPATITIRGSAAACWPELVLHLAVPQTTIEARNGGKFPDDSIYLDTAYNAALDTYYTRLADQATPAVLRLDGTRPTGSLLSDAAGRITRLLHDSRPPRRPPR